MKQNQYSYTVGGKEVYLDLDPDYIALKFDEPSRRSARAHFAAENEHLGEFKDRLEIPGEKYTVFKLSEIQKDRNERFMAAMANLPTASDIKSARPVFKSGNKRIVATDRIIIGLEEKSKDGAAAVINKYNCQQIQEKYGEYLLKVPDTKDPFQLVKEIQKEPGVQYAEPDFVTIGSNSNRNIKAKLERDSNEIDDNADLSHMQYALTITMADKAWEIHRGSKEVKIAILDEGVETTHPDLDSVIDQFYDATDDDTYQEPNAWDGHGTACCGLAVAKHKTFGIKGISAGCSAFAVRMAYSNSPGTNWITSNSIIGRAIDWSWENGADVLSNSWGGGAPSNAITNAFERARIRGRQGKGCVLVIAAGNEDAIVSYPGNLSEVLTVSASNEFDEPKTKYSKDGEYWWGSCYGPEVDVAAPGVHNLTTDITGEKGYNKDHNYTDFNGTSSATPIVAGIAGLVLSANPNLRESRVREIIKTSADKVGNVPYHEGHNDRMGFGRVNALNAVKAALALSKTKARAPRKKAANPKKLKRVKK